MGGLNESSILELSFFGKKHRYMIFRSLNDTSEFELVKTLDTSAAYSDMLNELPVDDCRFVFFQFDSKNVFLSWSPDQATDILKNFYNSMKGTIQEDISVVDLEISGTNLDEIGEEAVREKVQSL